MVIVMGLREQSQEDVPLLATQTRQRYVVVAALIVFTQYTTLLLLPPRRDRFLFLQMLSRSLISTTLGHVALVRNMLGRICTAVISGRPHGLAFHSEGYTTDTLYKMVTTPVHFLTLLALI